MPRQGSKIINAEWALKRMKAMYGDDFDPMFQVAQNAMKIQEFAESDDTMENRSAALQAWKEVLPYYYAKLRSVEVTGDPDAPLTAKITVEYVESSDP